MDQHLRQKQRRNEELTGLDKCRRDGHIYSELQSIQAFTQPTTYRITLTSGFTTDVVLPTELPDTSNICVSTSRKLAKVLGRCPNCSADVCSLYIFMAIMMWVEHTQILSFEEMQKRYPDKDLREPL
jgi:hypothetical protein